MIAWSARRRVSLAIALGIAACVPDEGPLMRPGQDCLACHSPEAPSGQHAKDWSLAGTVYAALDADPNAGVEGDGVEVTDSAGFAFSLRTNQAGNFYSAETVRFPLAVCVSRGGAKSCMQSPVASGACNACHQPGSGLAPGRIQGP